MNSSHDKFKNTQQLFLSSEQTQKVLLELFQESIDQFDNKILLKLLGEQKNLINSFISLNNQAPTQNKKNKMTRIAGKLKSQLQREKNMFETQNIKIQQYQRDKKIGKIFKNTKIQMENVYLSLPQESTARQSQEQVRDYYKKGDKQLQSKQNLKERVIIKNIKKNKFMKSDQDSNFQQILKNSFQNLEKQKLNGGIQENQIQNNRRTEIIQSQLQMEQQKIRTSIGNLNVFQQQKSYFKNNMNNLKSNKRIQVEKKNSLKKQIQKIKYKQIKSKSDITKQICCFFNKINGKSFMVS